MKRKITQLGRLFAAAALLWGATSVVSAQESLEINFTPFNAVDATPTITPEGIVSYTGVSLGENVVWKQARTVGEYQYYTFQSNVKHSSADASMISFGFNVGSAFNFTPKNLSCVMMRYGSDSQNEANIYITCDGVSTKLNSETIAPERNNASNPYTLVDLDIESLGLQLQKDFSVDYYWKMDSGKDVGVTNIVLTGTYEVGNVTKVAYVTNLDNAIYTYTDSTTTAPEAVYAALSAYAGFEVTPLNYGDVDLSAADNSAILESLTNDYDVVVLSGTGGSSTKLSTSWYLLLGKVPVLTTKAFWFQVGDPQGKKGGNPVTTDNGRYMVPTVPTHPIFEGITTDSEGKFEVFANSGASAKYLQSTGTLPGQKAQTGLSYIYSDADENDCIGEAWYDGGIGVVVIPFDADSKDYTVPKGSFTSDGAQLFVNAVNYLAEGEQYVAPHTITKVAYFTNVDSAAYGNGQEALFTALNKYEYFDVTAINNSTEELNEESAAQYAADYDVVVLAGSTGSSDNMAKTWNYLMGKMPILTTKAFWFEATKLSGGKKGTNAVSGEDSRYMVVNDTEHAIFEGITLDSDSKFAVFDSLGIKNSGRYLQASGTLPGGAEQTALSYIYSDTTTCIGEAWYGNGIVVIPFDAVDDTETPGALTSDGEQLFVNAVNYLMSIEATTLSPVEMSLEAKSEDPESEGYAIYTLTLTADEGASIYYTLDGTVPSEALGLGTLYEGPIELTQGCYIKAIAVADKCYDSELLEYTFVNDHLAPLTTPTISYDQGENYVDITISTDDEGDFAIYYTLDGTDPTTSSMVYTGTFRTYKESVTVKAIAIGETYTSSEIGELEVTNTGYTPMEKTLYYSDFLTVPTNETDLEGNTVGWYYATATAELSESAIAAGITIDTDGRPTIFAKSSETWNRYKDYNGWSFYAATNRRILIQKTLDPGNTDATKGACYMLNAAVDASAGPMETIQGPFDVEIYAKGGSSASADVYILVGTDECESAEGWSVIGKGTVSGGSVAEQFTASYTGTDEVYVRVYTNSTELYLYDFKVKGLGYDPLELQSVDPAGSTSSATPVTIDADQSEFVLTFNNAIDYLSGEGYVYFGTETGTGENNCEISIEDNVVTVTRPGAETALEPGLYRLRINGLVDVAGQTLANTNYFYLVEEAAEPEPAEGDVAYVYKSAYGTLNPSNDPFVALLTDYTVVGVDMNEDEAPDIDALSQYDLVILSEAMSGAKTYTNGLVDLVGQVPVISFKDFNYTDGRWSWATPVNPSKGITYITPNEAGLAHAIFAGITPDEDGNVTIFDTEDSSNNEVQAWQLSTMTDAMSAANPTVLAYTAASTDYATVHICEPAGGYNYVLLPFSSDALGKGTSGITADAETIFLNAFNWLIGSEPNEGGESTGVVAPEAAKTAVNVEYFSITGAAQNGLVKGINLIRTTYDDGTVEVSKVLSNE